VQWAAVRISVLLIREPPQKGLDENWLLMSPTCQGYSFSEVATPPTILETLLAVPHWHPEEGGEGAGAGDGDGAGVGAGVGAGGGKKAWRHELAT